MNICDYTVENSCITVFMRIHNFSFVFECISVLLCYWFISFHGITGDYFVTSVKVIIDQPDVPRCLLDRLLHPLGILLFIDVFITG